MSNPAPSSHPGREPQPVNPYASSRVPEPEASALSEPVPHVSRTYSVRVTWKDRQAWLRSIGPMRLGAVGIALLWAKQLMDLMQRWPGYYRLDGWVSLVFAAFSLSLIVQALVALYLCWLSWRFADVIRSVAGGATCEMREWSRLTYRTSSLSAIGVALGLATEIAKWLIAEAAEQRLFTD